MQLTIFYGAIHLETLLGVNTYVLHRFGRWFKWNAVPVNALL